jgi:tetrahydromethanopterin S-methyltransferase subunit H
LPAKAVSAATDVFDLNPAEKLVREKLVDDGIVDYDGLLPFDNSEIVNREKLSTTHYSAADIVLMLQFNDRDKKTTERLKVLSFAKKLNLIEEGVLSLDEKTGQPSVSDWKKLTDLNVDVIYALANIFRHPSDYEQYVGSPIHVPSIGFGLIYRDKFKLDALREDLEKVCEAKRDVLFVAKKLRHEGRAIA